MKKKQRAYKAKKKAFDKKAAATAKAKFTSRAEKRKVAAKAADDNFTAVGVGAAGLLAVAGLTLLSPFWKEEKKAKKEAAGKADAPTTTPAAEANQI